jgi:ABC-2 type transport system permease protein
MIFGTLLDLPEWAMNLSPIEATPRLPYEDLTTTAPVVLLGIAVTLGLAGVLDFRHRDLG